MVFISMRRFDKKKQIEKANILAEQRHLSETKPELGSGLQPEPETFSNIPELEPILEKYGLLEIIKEALNFYKKNGETRALKIIKVMYDYGLKHL